MILDNSTKATLQILFFLFILLPGKIYSQETDSPLKTQPSGADVMDDKKNKLGTTPFDLNSLKEGIETITVEKEGYEPVEIALLPKKKKTYSFPGSIAACSSCPFIFEDPAAKEDYKGTLRLRKKISEYDRYVMVAVDTPVVSIAVEKELGRVNGSSRKLKDKEIHILLGYAENMDIRILNAFEDSYLDASYLSTKDKSKTTLYKPKIIFKPEVKDLSFNLRGKLLRDYYGSCTIQCNWKIATVSEPKKILAQLPITTTIYRAGDNYDLVLHQMIAESERDLLQNDTLFNFLVKVEKQYLLKSKGEVFKIKPTKRVTFPSSKEMLKEIKSSVVTVENREGFGSGVIISDEGYIITNFHVVEEEKNVFVKMGKENKIKAEIIKVNSDYDLALLKIPTGNLKALNFAAQKADVGDEVYAAGTPLEKSLGQTVTKGIVSGFREWNGVSFIQTDVSINAGNSGGPLVNDKGEIIGITTMKAFGKGIEGIGFCIPAEEVIEMMNLKFE
jgi:serine protease Do